MNLIKDTRTNNINKTLGNRFEQIRTDGRKKEYISLPYFTYLILLEV